MQFIKHVFPKFINPRNPKIKKSSSEINNHRGKWKLKINVRVTNPVDFGFSCLYD